MKRICIFLGDAQGNSAIVEAEAVIRKQGPYQISTNYRQSLIPPSRSACRRYNKANTLLSQADGFSVDLFRRVCAATHQEDRNPTLYSTVYDLKQRVIHLYHFHDFDNVIEFDLQKELAKGERVVEMHTLFPPKANFLGFRRRSETQPSPK